MVKEAEGEVVVVVKVVLRPKLSWWLLSSGVRGGKGVGCQGGGGGGRESGVVIPVS